LVVLETRLGFPEEQRNVLGAAGRIDPPEGPQVGFGAGTVGVAVNVCALGMRFNIPDGTTHVESQSILAVCSLACELLGLMIKKLMHQSQYLLLILFSLLFSFDINIYY